MKRTGFARPIYQRQPPSAPKPIERGTVARVGDAVRAVPKENVITSPAYQAIVRKLPCAICGIEGYTQFCHSDEGKGMGIKTDDRRGWPGCGPHMQGGQMVNGCHYFVGTSGSLTREQRREVEDRLSRRTRAKVIAAGDWPATLQKYYANPDDTGASSY